MAKRRQTPDEIHDKKVKFITKSLAQFDGAAVKLQNDFLNIVIGEYLPKFDAKDGVILDTPKNIDLIGEVDRLFDRISKALQRDVLGKFASDLITSASLSADYYVGMGFKKSIVTRTLRDKVQLERRLGMTAQGKLKKDGYLYRLGRTEGARIQLKDYVIKSLTGDTSFTDFQLGFRNLVKGNRRVKGVPTTGFLQQYFDQYAYDTFNQMDAVTNKRIASELALEHFIYEGSVIKTSRKFCIKRAGKAFKVSETKTWKNDPDLIDKKNKDTYNPLIDRGRYRCRHFIKYITAETYTAITGKDA